MPKGFCPAAFRVLRKNLGKVSEKNKKKTEKTGRKLKAIRNAIGMISYSNIQRKRTAFLLGISLHFRPFIIPYGFSVYNILMQNFVFLLVRVI